MVGQRRGWGRRLDRTLAEGNSVALVLRVALGGIEQRVEGIATVGIKMVEGGARDAYA